MFGPDNPACNYQTLLAPIKHWLVADCQAGYHWSVQWCNTKTCTSTELHHLPLIIISTATRVLWCQQTLKFTLHTEQKGFIPSLKAIFHISQKDVVFFLYVTMYCVTWQGIVTFVCELQHGLGNLW